MEPYTPSPAFQYWVASLVVLFFKMGANSAVQGIVRIQSGLFPRPEDSALFGKGKKAPGDHPTAELASKAWRNDLENIPIYLFLGLAFLLAGGSERGAAIYFSTFTVARIFHTVFYVKPKQPHRSICYLVGMLVSVSLAIHTAVLVF